MGKPDPILEIEKHRMASGIDIETYKQCYCGEILSVRTHEDLPTGYVYCLECRRPISLARLHERK